MDKLIGKARGYLDSRRGERVTLEELASAVGASPFHLQRRFKEALGLSPKDYQREQQLEDTKRLLANGSRVTDAVFAAGYGSVSRFYEKAVSRPGMGARDYRAKGKGLRILFSSFASPLGAIPIPGPVFQRLVCKQLLACPCVEPRSYGDIARAIGNPKAVRAVGSACGANPGALVVPCHRARRSAGSLGGGDRES